MPWLGEGNGNPLQWVLSPGKSHGLSSLVGCTVHGVSRSRDTAERLHFHFSLSCVGEGNGNPFQCSCLENPRDGGAWWAAVHGVAQSETRLRRPSSSSSSSSMPWLVPPKPVCSWSQFCALDTAQDSCTWASRQWGPPTRSISEISASLIGEPGKAQLPVHLPYRITGWPSLLGLQWHGLSLS